MNEKTLGSYWSFRCGAKPSIGDTPCLLDADHPGPHRWWDEHGEVKWVPHSELWRNEPDARRREEP